MKLGQKSVKSLVGFLWDLKTWKFHSEINWPLESSSAEKAELILLAKGEENPSESIVNHPVHRESLVVV